MDKIQNFSNALNKVSSLPIYPYLDKICSTLKDSLSHFLILTAETASGKSTVLPVSILENFDGKILMLEPRRLAASSIAERISDLIDEKVGSTVGYRIHLNSKVSEKTRLEIITEAILIRKLQNDPLLEDINVIIIDEFHERSIFSDLALAFLKETMKIRDDLYVIIMSATINYRSLENYLSDSFHPSIMQISGRQFPVEIEYKNNISMTEAIFKEISNKNNKIKSLLVFLPGIFEIKKTKSEIEELIIQNNIKAEISILHSSISFEEQKKILSPKTDYSIPRIILSSSIAETSLTVPDVNLVIDSGLCRLNKMNFSSGMEHLVTEKESLFSANQRSGRAGRTEKGRCIRLWDKNEPKIEQTPPEILRTDLTTLVLECVNWGASNIDKIDWLTKPSESAWNSAKFLLEKLDCIEINKNSNEEIIKITEKGKKILTLGLHPRLACAALCGGAESILPFTEYKNKSNDYKTAFLNDLKKRLESTGYRENKNSNFLLAGFPDRLALLYSKNHINCEKAEYIFPSGRTAWLSRENIISKNLNDFPEWIIAPVADAGEKTGKIYSFEIISDKEVYCFLKNHEKKQIKTEFIESENNKDFKNMSIKKREITSYGEIILKEKNLSVESDDFALAICDSVIKKGLKILPLDSKIEEFLLRAEFYVENSSKNSQELKKKLKSLEKLPEVWLRPFVKSQKINALDVYEALYWYLDGNIIDSNVPVQITLSNGKKRKIKYEKKADGTIQPVLEIIIQQIFGVFENPKILEIPVLLKLLSPASRPLQITNNLENFWNGAWIEICKEMKGRYPKHNWNYKIILDEQ
ncbi:ATP-dependent helicase C-terminal domain-containing protein [Treponema sp.]|uniref:ATP-dependent helicase C-terminal domain-containing protein n=1 Tax=Treponema sp. TaxID=166 RepID=UPI0038908B49